MRFLSIRKKLHNLLMLIVIFFSLPRLSVAGEPVEVVVLAIEYPPYVSAKLSNNGYVFQLLTEFLGSVLPDVRLKAAFLPPARVNQHINEGQWCMSFYPPTGNNRFWRLNLSEEKLKIGLYHRAGDSSIDWGQPLALAGKKVAVLRALTKSSFIERFREIGVIPVYVESVHQGIKMLQHKRIDAAMGDSSLKKQLEISEGEQVAIQFSDSVVKKVNVGVYVNSACTISEVLKRRQEQG